MLSGINIYQPLNNRSVFNLLLQTEIGTKENILKQKHPQKDDLILDSQF